ncbi:hypothetical protein V492_00340 [Pseudogymnoascus sp. VKM F-4246]|nr:hypothetical protein V492_00340 [Pseudogymnoascus sp. VKM F-4246]
MAVIQVVRLLRRETALRSTLFTEHRRLLSTQSQARGTYYAPELALCEAVTPVEKNVKSATIFQGRDTPLKIARHACRANALRTLILHSGLTQTVDGCQWLVRNSSRLIAAIDKVFSIKLADRNMRRLKFLNETLKTIEAQGVEMESYLCATALSYALRPRCILRMPSCAKDYLDKMASRKYVDELFEHPAIKSGYSAQLIRQTIRQKHPFHVYPNTLPLLTGWKVDGRPSPGEQQQLCQDKFKQDIVRAAEFTGAFLRANDPWGAMNVLRQASLHMDDNRDFPAFVRLVREAVDCWKTVLNPNKWKRVVYILLDHAEKYGLSEDDDRRQDLERRVRRARRWLGYI